MLFPVDSDIFGCHAETLAALNNVLKVHLVGLPTIQTMTRLLFPRETEDHLVDVDLEGPLEARYVMYAYLHTNLRYPPTNPGIIGALFIPLRLSIP